MSKKKNLNELHTHDEYVTFALQHGGSLRHGGEHDIVYTDKGSCALPRHKGPYGKGLDCKIKKLFLLIGLGLILVVSYGAIYQIGTSIASAIGIL